MTDDTEFVDEPVAVTDSALAEYVDDALEAYMEYVEYEVRAAWRLGFEYTHHYHDFSWLPRKEPREWGAVLPSDSPHPPSAGDELQHVSTYELDDETMQQLEFATQQ